MPPLTFLACPGYRTLTISDPEADPDDLDHALDHSLRDKVASSGTLLYLCIGHERSVARFTIGVGLSEGADSPEWEGRRDVVLKAPGGVLAVGDLDGLGFGDVELPHAGTYDVHVRWKGADRAYEAFMEIHGASLDAGLPQDEAEERLRPLDGMEEFVVDLRLRPDGGD